MSKIKDFLKIFALDVIFAVVLLLVIMADAYFSSGLLLEYGSAKLSEMTVIGVQVVLFSIVLLALGVFKHFVGFEK